jgi:hypothetical protein
VRFALRVDLHIPRAVITLLETLPRERAATTVAPPGQVRGLDLPNERIGSEPDGATPRSPPAGVPPPGAHPARSREDAFWRHAVRVGPLPRGPLPVLPLEPPVDAGWPSSVARAWPPSGRRTGASTRGHRAVPALPALPRAARRSPFSARAGTGVPGDLPLGGRLLVLVRAARSASARTRRRRRATGRGRTCTPGTAARARLLSALPRGAGAHHRGVVALRVGVAVRREACRRGRGSAPSPSPAPGGAPGPPSGARARWRGWGARGCTPRAPGSRSPR